MFHPSKSKTFFASFVSYWHLNLTIKIEPRLYHYLEDYWDREYANNGEEILYSPAKYKIKDQLRA